MRASYLVASRTSQPVPTARYEMVDLVDMRAALEVSGQDGRRISVGVLYDHATQHYRPLTPILSLPSPPASPTPAQLLRRTLLSDLVGFRTTEDIVNIVGSLAGLHEYTFDQLVDRHVPHWCAQRLARLERIGGSQPVSRSLATLPRAEQHLWKVLVRDHINLDSVDTIMDMANSVEMVSEDLDRDLLKMVNVPLEQINLLSRLGYIGSGFDAAQRSSSRPATPGQPSPLAASPAPEAVPKRNRKRKRKEVPNWSDKEASTEFLLANLNDVTVTGLGCFKSMPKGAFGDLKPRLTGRGLSARYDKIVEMIHPDKHPDDAELYRPAYQKLVSAYGALQAKDGASHRRAVADDEEGGDDVEPQDVALVLERRFGELTNPNKTAHIIGVTISFTKRKGVNQRKLTDDDRMRMVGRVISSVDKSFKSHPLNVLVEHYGATRERGDANSQLHGQTSQVVLSSGGEAGAAAWVEALYTACAKGAVTDVSGGRIADSKIHVVVREPHGGETFEEAAMDHLMYVMKDFEAKKPWAQTAGGGHARGGRKFPGSHSYAAAWAAFKASRTDVNAHGLKKRHFSYTAGATGGGSRCVKNTIAVNTNNFVVTTIEWLQNNRLWNLYPSLLRGLAWMIENGSHELQVALVFGGRGYPMDEARANAFHAVNIDPRRATDLNLIRLIFCGVSEQSASSTALADVLYRPSFLANEKIVEDMTYADACQWRDTNQFPLRYRSWYVLEAPNPIGRALVIDMGAKEDSESVVAMNELREAGFAVTPILYELGNKVDKEGFVSLGLLSLVVDMVETERKITKKIPSFAGVTLPRALGYTEQAFAEFVDEACAPPEVITSDEKILAVVKALRLNERVASMDANGLGILSWATFTERGSTLDQMDMVIIAEAERQHHFAVVVCTSTTLPTDAANVGGFGVTQTQPQPQLQLQPQLQPQSQPQPQPQCQTQPQSQPWPQSQLRSQSQLQPQSQLMLTPNESSTPETSGPAS
mmetsp:Transcript_36600/g.97886  ORF Transcript_36600/g.97886 Transcript_36600/m.97886 type:complete len:987 (+) Transcript_36600:1021-3981(+)